MGASVIGVLVVLLAIAALVVWGLAALLGPIGAMAICFIIVCLLMMLVILIQKPKGGGLSGAFGGGGGGSDAAFGAKTGDVLTVATICLFILFLGLAMGLTIASKPAEVIAMPTEIIVPEDETTTTTTSVVPEIEQPEETVVITDEATDAAPVETPAPASDSDAPAETAN